jgi:hypothetical protein
MKIHSKKFIILFLLISEMKFMLNLKAQRYKNIKLKIRNTHLKIIKNINSMKIIMKAS